MAKYSFSRFNDEIHVVKSYKKTKKTAGMSAITHTDHIHRKLPAFINYSEQEG